MAITADIVAFRSRFGVFSAFSEAIISGVIDTVDILLDTRVWPNQADFALARQMLAAHMLTLQQNQLTSSGSVINAIGNLYADSIGIGERRVRFGQINGFGELINKLSPVDGTYMLTIYGQTFLQLRNRNIIGAALI